MLLYEDTNGNYAKGFANLILMWKVSSQWKGNGGIKKPTFLFMKKCKPLYIADLTIVKMLVLLNYTDI